MPPSEPIEARFWRKVQKTDSCWLWTGSVSSRTGAGAIAQSRTRKLLSIGRVSWEIHFGPIPSKHVIVRSCSEILCVRPDHLRAVPRTGLKQYRTPEDRFWGRVQKTDADGCWIWTGYLRNAYGQIEIDGKTIRAHRASWVFHHGEIPAGMIVCHRCDNPPCVNPKHLFLGTHASNMADKVSKGRQARGKKLGIAKLSMTHAQTIRKIYKNGKMSMYAIAQHFGVSHKTISNIVRNLIWKPSQKQCCRPMSVSPKGSTTAGIAPS